MYPTLQECPGNIMSPGELTVFSGLFDPNVQKVLPDDDTPSVMPRAIEKLDKEPILRIFAGRLEHAGVRTTPRLRSLIYELCAGNPGKAVLWAYTIFRKARPTTKGERIYTFQHWVEDYANGAPSEDEYTRCWDGQKVNGGNGLDLTVTWLPSAV